MKLAKTYYDITQKKISPMWDWWSTLLLSGFQALVTLTLTLDRVIRYTTVHQSLTSIYTPNFTEIGKTFLSTDCPQGPLQVQGHVTQKRTNIKNPAGPNLDIVL